MKSIRWIGWVALVALFTMMLAAAPALAAPNFAGTPLKGYAPMEVTFTPSGVTGTPDSVTWSFGDGGWASGTGVKTHTYTAGASQFSVIMNVWYPGPVDSAVSKTNYVTTTTGSFTGTPLAGVVPMTTVFTPTGLFGAPDSVTWTFGDGGFIKDSVGQVSHTYTSGPATRTVAMHVWYAGPVETTLTRVNYVQLLAPQIVIDSVDKAPCGGIPNQNLPDTVHFQFYAPPADSIWWIIQDTTLPGGRIRDSIKTVGSGKNKMSWVFTWPDTFIVTGKPYLADTLLKADTARILYISSSCYCVKAVLDGYSMNENDTLRAFVLDNDTLGNKNQPRPVDSVKVMTHKPFNGTVLDTAYFDTTSNGLRRLIYIPQANWHGKDTITYQVWVHDGCNNGVSNTATVAITVYSNFRVDIDTVYYQWKNTRNCGSCDAQLGGTINIGDSLQVWVKINPVDVQELAPGWPKAFFAGMGGSPAGNVLYKDTTSNSTHGGFTAPSKDSIYFSFPFQDTARPYPDWMVILGGGIDVNPGFYPIIAQALSDSAKLSADTTLVDKAIDTKPVTLPPVSVTFTESFDTLGNGIVGVGDWLKFYIDLRNNPIVDHPEGSKEICNVYVNIDSLWGGPSVHGPIMVPLYDSANDNRFKGYYRVGPGRLEAPANSQTGWFYITDNGCNFDSVSAKLADPVDNKIPDSLGTIVYKELLDRDSTNCLGVGPSDPLADSVLIRVTGVPTDITSLYADLLRAGIGGCGNLPLIAKYPLVSKGGGVWELRWLLKTCTSPDSVVHPYDHDTISPTFQGYAANDSIKLTGFDNSGNWVSKWKVGLDPIINGVTLTLDTRVPKPVTGLACRRDTTSAGTPRFTLTWLTQDADAEKFLIFWNDGCGDVKYTDTLAVLFMPRPPTMSAAAPINSWQSDSTVKPISPCRNYKFDVWTVDHCNNVERVHPTPTNCGITVTPVIALSATNPLPGTVHLQWTGTDSSAAKYYIYWDGGTGTINYSTKLDSVIGGPGANIWDSTNCSIFRPGFAGDSTYKFAVRTVDSCTVNTPSCPNYDNVGAATTVNIRHIIPVTQLTCQSIQNGAIQLRWRSSELPGWFGAMYIHYGKDSANAIDWTKNVDTITYHQAGVWVADSGFYRWNTTMANPVPNMVEKGLYAFTVQSVDGCGYSEVTHPTPTFCYSDKAPAYACVIQPAPGNLYCDNTYHGLTIYTCAKDSASNDIKSVTAWGRLQDISPSPGNQPGDWFVVGTGSQIEPGVCFHVNLDPNQLNYQAGADTVQRIEIAIGTTDVVGKVVLADEAWANCSTHYWFDWSTRVIDGKLLTINGQQRVLQVACNKRGYQIYGPTNPVAISVTGGTPPYVLQVVVDHQKYLYQERVSPAITFNLNATNFTKGSHYLEVFWSDSCGWTGSAKDSLCVPDSLPPCAEVTNPVDGKCIRRSRTMQDPIGQYENPIEITIKGNDLTPNGRHCVDQGGVLKVDFQWARTCCAGGTTTCSTWAVKDSTPRTGGGTGGICDTFFTGAHMDSIICTDTSFSGWKYFFRDTTVCKPCTDEWKTFAIDSANNPAQLVYHAKWYNKEDLAWITQSGTNIYLRGVVYDVNGNIFYTPCTQVCIDIDTPPICIRTENLCPDGRLKRWAKILAELDWANGHTDDIESITLWTKKQSEPDLYGYWHEWGTGEPATNSTMWTWSLDLNQEYFADQTYYDFRVIAKTTWGTWSYDLDGNGQFDANTFDTTHCDSKTWLIDKTAPKIAMDTAWTTINGNNLVIPNTGCRVSDPKGYVWTQYGNTITVQPTIYPLTDKKDVVKTQWTLYDGESEGGATCNCAGPQTEFDANEGNSYVFAVNEGANAMNKLVFDPTKAPFVHVKDGYQKHVLHVKAWDGCGNTSEDCIAVYILDIDTTEAVIISPVNDSTFCDKMTADGGILLQAATLLHNEMQKAVFKWRLKGTTTWTPIDSVQIPPGEGSFSVVWYPKALGLADGDYEVSVWATDGALNHQTGDGFPVTIHLSCAVPTVAMTNPAPHDTIFIGCPIELTATTLPYSNTGNPIVEVDFYIQSITSSESFFIGSDNFTVDGYWSVSWDPHSAYWKSKLSDGRYYIWASARNRAGLVTKSVLKDVVVRYDKTGPHSEIIQVNGDRSDGGATDPTIVKSGAVVPLYVLSADDLSPAGYGLTDNSGLDSVMIYVTEDESIGGKVVFGELMTPVDSLSGLYVKNWPTTGWPRGLYHVTAVAIDKACNRSSCKCDWLVRIVNDGYAVIGVTEAKTYCGIANIKDGPIHLTLAPAVGEAVKAVEFWRASTTSSDVWDQWTFIGVSNSAVNDTFTYVVDAEDVAAWTPGTYRLRAFYQSTDNTWIDDGNANGKFDDFTFDPASKTWQMLLKVDRAVTPFTVALNPSMTLWAGRQVKVTVTPTDACDVAEVCYGAVAENGNYGQAKNGCVDSLHFSFNPIDSGLVSANHGMWHGAIRTTVSDPLGNAAYTDVPLWILELPDTNEVRVVDWSPRSHVSVTLQGDYVTGAGDTLATLTARKLTWTSLDSVVFYHDPTATGAGSRIGKAAKTTGSDEFVVNWNIKNVTEGEQYVWGVAWRGASSFANGPKTWVTLVKTPGNTNHWLRDPIPHSIRTVGPDQIMFVGGRVDLCLNRDSITSNMNGVGIDSVVFGYRFGNAPGGPVPDKFDPSLGWVRIDADRYGSLCVDWFSCDSAASYCQDGRYALVAWVYDKAGHVNHSNIVHVMVDCTKPYSEIVDIDGDETFGSCHDITLTGNDTKVKFTANAVDDKSCAGTTPGYNSGAKFLQFFVGTCGEGSGGKADIIWVIDGSGSMSDNQTAIANGAAAFSQAMGKMDVRYGVLGFGTEQKLIALDGSHVDGGAGLGAFTSDPAVLATMVSGVGTSFGGSEIGLTALTDALTWYTFRPDAKKVFILVTDAHSQEGSGVGAMIQALQTSGAMINTVICLSGTCDGGVTPDTVGFSSLAGATQGIELDINSGDWGANLGALASQIKAVAGKGTGNDVGVIWGSGVVTLTDGQDNAFALWNPRGLKTGSYCAWTVVTDQVGHVYTSIPRSICIYDKTPPVGWIAGFGTSTDTSNAHAFFHEYAIYGRTADSDVDHVQIQYRPSTSTTETDWTGIGISRKVNGDSTLWMADWNPCLETGPFDFRMVPTDKSGNENFDIQPILKVQLDGSCGVTFPSGPPATFKVTLEDRAFANLGLVNVDGVPTNNNPTSMVAVYADLNNGLAAEKVALRYDVGNPAHMMGSFNDGSILNGGSGWFYAVYNDFTAKRTYLRKADLNVWMVDNVGLPGTLTNATTGTKVTLELEALTSTNGVVIYPARVPLVWLDQQQMVAWPTSSDGMLTAIRLTNPLDEAGIFNPGKYAEIELSYDRAMTQAAGIQDNDLSIAWWDGDHWNTNQDIIAMPGKPTANGKAYFATRNLHGVYAVVSHADLECRQVVAVQNIAPASGAISNPWPSLKASITSKINAEWENHDIDPRHIIVLLDGVTIFADDEPATGWNGGWDEVSGRLVLSPDQPYCGYSYDNSPAKRTVLSGLAAGSHWMKVKAANKQGFWGCDSTGFTVDAAKPVVTPEADTVRNVGPYATFHFKVADAGAGVNWDSVFVDVFDFTESVADEYPLSRVITTLGPDNLRPGRAADGTVTFTLNGDFAEGRRLKIVIYDGIRVASTECGCVHYDHVCDGVPDLVGNHTSITEVTYTVQVVDKGDGTPTPDATGGSSNPFDPYSAGFLTIQLNGFGRNGTVTAIVYDLTGEKVKTLTPGKTSVSWDGSTDESDTKKVAEGVYLIHLQRTGGSAVGATSHVMKVVVKRK